MSTKENPGTYNAYAKAEPDEPMFVLLARDREAPAVIRIWATLWLQELKLGIRPESDRAQVEEALRCMSEMEIWHRQWAARRERETMEFDAQGVPLTGQHAKLARNSTSGANDV